MVKIVVNPEYKEIEREIRDLIHAIVEGKELSLRQKGSDKFLPEGGEFIYEGRNNLFKINADRVSVVVKDFKRANFLNRYVYTTLRKSKARRSYENAVRMKELGFFTPDPIAYAEVKKGVRLVWSFYISAELSDATEMRRWEDHPDAEQLLTAFANEIYKLHTRGVWHKDFSPGNVLFVRDGNEGYDFYHVDLNRMKFGVHDKKRQMRMFRAINLKTEETERIARKYAQRAGIDEATMVKRALKELEGYFRERRMKGGLRI